MANVFDNRDFHVDVPSINDVPETPYSVVYDAEYTGFKPRESSTYRIVTGQTVSLFDPDIRTDECFGIREIRSLNAGIVRFVHGQDQILRRDSDVRTLTKSEFVELMNSGFDRNSHVGTSVGHESFDGSTSGGISLRDMKYNGTILGAWPDSTDGYANAVVSAVSQTGWFENFDLDTVRDAWRYCDAAYDPARHNFGPDRSDLVTREEAIDEVQTHAPDALNVTNFVWDVRMRVHHACELRAFRNDSVRSDNPSTLLDRLAFNEHVRAVEMTPFTASLSDLGIGFVPNIDARLMDDAEKDTSQATESFDFE